MNQEKENQMKKGIMNQAGEVELIYKTMEDGMIYVKSAVDAQDLARRYFSASKMNLREEFWAFYFDRSNKFIGALMVSSGSTAGTVVDVKHIIYTAMQLNASAMILSHNHPSGNLQPSQADISLTAKLSSAAQLFDVKILDHVILSSTTYYSFADNGQL